MLNYLIPVVNLLENLFISNTKTFLTTELVTTKIKFSVIIITIAILFIFVWTPYLKNLSNKIWRTKGMLKMIPLEIITKNENLKNAFLSGDILEAVK